MLDLHVEEMSLSCLAPGLRRCVHLLAALDGIQGHAAAQWGDTKTQGGTKTAAAERLVELKDELRMMPPRLVKVACLLRGYPVQSARGRYIQGILSGHSGEALRKAAGLSHRKMEDCRRWLRGVVPSTPGGEMPCATFKSKA